MCHGHILRRVLPTAWRSAPPIKVTQSLDRAVPCPSIPCLSNTLSYEQVSQLPYHAVPSAHRFKGDLSFSYIYVLLRRLRMPHGFNSFVSQTIDEAEVDKNRFAYVHLTDKFAVPA